MKFPLLYTPTQLQRMLNILVFCQLLLGTWNLIWFIDPLIWTLLFLILINVDKALPTLILFNHFNIKIYSLSCTFSWYIFNLVCQSNLFLRISLSIYKVKSFLFSCIFQFNNYLFYLRIQFLISMFLIKWVIEHTSVIR